MPDKKNKPANKPAVQAPATPITQQQQSGFRTFIIVAVVITILFVLGGGYLIYQLAQLNIRKNNEIRAQDAYLTLARYKKQQLDKSEQAMADLKKAAGNKPSDFDLVTKRALPTKSDFESVINIMNSLQNESLVTVENITLETGSTAGATTTSTSQTNVLPSGAQQLPIGIKVTAGYDAIQDFFKKVESSVRVFDFQSMKLSGSAQGNTLDMKYQTYYIAEPSIDDKKVSLPEYEKAVSANKDTYK